MEDTDTDRVTNDSFVNNGEGLVDFSITLYRNSMYV